MKGFSNNILILLPQDEALESLPISVEAFTIIVNNLVEIFNNDYDMQCHFLYTNADIYEKLSGDIECINNVLPEDKFIFEEFFKIPDYVKPYKSKTKIKVPSNLSLKDGMNDDEIITLIDKRIKFYSKEICNGYKAVCNLQRSKYKLCTPKKLEGHLYLDLETDFTIKSYLGEKLYNIKNLLGTEKALLPITKWRGGKFNG